MTWGFLKNIFNSYTNMSQTWCYEDIPHADLQTQDWLACFGGEHQAVFSEGGSELFGVRASTSFWLRSSLPPAASNLGGHGLLLWQEDFQKWDSGKTPSPFFPAKIQAICK